MTTTTLKLTREEADELHEAVEEHLMHMKARVRMIAEVHMRLDRAIWGFKNEGDEHGEQSSSTGDSVL